MAQYLHSAALSAGRYDLLRALDAKIGHCATLLAQLAASEAMEEQNTDLLETVRLPSNSMA